MIHIQLRKEPASKRFSREHSPRFTDDLHPAIINPQNPRPWLQLTGWEYICGSHGWSRGWAISSHSVHRQSSQLEYANHVPDIYPSPSERMHVIVKTCALCQEMRSSFTNARTCITP